MRPLRLTMTAFGPYAGTETVDFDALTELGLFVVAGNNGSGKTTIFDALHYSLYGTLPGSRASYIRLKSDHADNSAECSVTLDFAAHGKHWRVTRSPKQQRPKRRGKGFTEAPAAATLFRLDPGTIDQGVPTAITNRVEEVRAQCTELVGLSGKQFERVALLPQGQFSRVLSESSTDRRELLRTLFSSEIFGDATTLLTDQAALATAADRAVLDRLDHQQAALADELSTLVAQPLTNTLPALGQAIADHRHGHITGVSATVAKLEATATQARHDHQAAVETTQRVQRRVQVQLELEQHQRAFEQHQRDLGRLQHARAAVPVTSNARTLAGHEQHLAQARHRLTELQHKLNRTLTAAGLDQLDDLNSLNDRDAKRLHATGATLTALSDKLSHRHVVGARVDDLERVTNHAHADVRRVANEIRSLDEQQRVAQTQHRQASADLNRLQDVADVEQCEIALRHAAAQLEQRIELAELEAAHNASVRQATELDTKLESLEHDRDGAHQAHTNHVSLQHKADNAFVAYEEFARRRDAALRFQDATTKLQQARNDLGTTQAQADQLWDAFISGTAARVAQALVDDEPCPVCGSAEHPAPAQHAATGAIATESDVAAARSKVDAAQTAVRSTEAEIEALRMADNDIASLSVTELAAEISTSKAMALGAQAVADEARTTASHYDRIANELAETTTRRRELDDELRALDQRRSRQQGALGDVANEPVAELRARADAAAAARAEAEQHTTRTAELVTQIASLDQTIDTLGLEEIAATSRHASAQGQLRDRQTNYAHACSELEAVDVDIAESVSPLVPTASGAPTSSASNESPATNNSTTNNSTTNNSTTNNTELRSQATRRGLELVAETNTAFALAHDAADAVRRAQSVLSDRLTQSRFATLEAAMAAFVEPELIEQLEAQTAQHSAADERLRGQLHELADVPDTAPDIAELAGLARQAADAFAHANRTLISVTAALDRIEHDLNVINTERDKRQTSDGATRRLERVAAIVKGDNDRNTSLENWVLAAHLRDVVELANVRLARSTHQRFQLCVLDDGENKRGKWGLDLGVEDTVTGTQRPTAGLSGGELFQASLALALGLADAVMNQSAGVRIDALFIDEGFGSLDETSVERAIDLLDELRDRGAMVGVITHVPALLDALPLGVSVVDAANGHGSTIRQAKVAA